MEDKIEIFGKGSIIQHGKSNNRVYLLKMKEEDFPEIISYINRLARENKYTKIFAKIPEWANPGFKADGFIIEAFIPDFYNGEVSAFFMSKFLSSDRLLGIEVEKLKELGSVFAEKQKKKPKMLLAEEFNFRQLKKEDIDQMTNVFKEVFKTYPFPIYKPEYIVDTMDDGVVYFGVFDGGKLVAISSSEVDMEGGNSEMTDFASLPDYRGKKLSVILLQAMEKRMKEIGINTLYTIARLNSIPMNKTFIREGYRFAGTLINNTHISGGIESMNVFYKNI